VLWPVRIYALGRLPERFRQDWRPSVWLIAACVLLVVQVGPGQSHRASAKTPSLEGGEPFSFAGLGTPWTRPTARSSRAARSSPATPNELTRPIHNRMPVILADPDAWESWLEPMVGATAAQELLVPLPAQMMVVRPANPIVNSGRHEGRAQDLNRHPLLARARAAEVQSSRDAARTVQAEGSSPTRPRHSVKAAQRRPLPEPVVPTGLAPRDATAVGSGPDPRSAGCANRRARRTWASR
jgi:hypothetical protein